MTARIKKQLSRLDGQSGIAENGSRREKLRLERLLVRYEKVLVRLVNAREFEDLRSVVKGFPDLMPPGAEKIDWQASFNEQGGSAQAAWTEIELAQQKLRTAWKLPHGLFRQYILIELAGNCIKHHFGGTLQTFVWGLGQFGNAHSALSREFSDAMRRIDRPVFQDPKFPLVMFAALRVAPKMRVCQNRGCPHPFYLRSEGGKMFCSPACAKPTRDNAKLRWWNAHKKELLAQRRKKRKRSKRASRRKTQQRGKRQ